jgi:hypothetical protein
LGPREVEFGTVKQSGVGPQFRVGTVTAGRSLKIKNLTVENKNRHGDSACRGMAPKRASKQQQQLNVDQFKLFKKPMDHLGKQINVPGSFWQDRMLPEEARQGLQVHNRRLLAGQQVRTRFLAQEGFQNAGDGH